MYAKYLLYKIIYNYTKFTILHIFKKKVHDIYLGKRNTT